MATFITVSGLHKHFTRRRYIFVDKEEIYYFWQLNYSAWGLHIEIVAMKQTKDDFITIKTPKSEKIGDYLKEIFFEKSDAFIGDFFEKISFYEFEIPPIHTHILGEKFKNKFLLEQDIEFIFRDKFAKHLIIDFDKIENRDLCFFYQPKLFPLYIPEIDVTVTEEAELFQGTELISLDYFWLVYEKYLYTLQEKIKYKDKIFSSIEKDLKKRRRKAVSQIKVEEIHDYKIDTYLTIFDGFLNDEILNIIFLKDFFDDTEGYSLSLYGLDINVGMIMYRLIDTYGLKIILPKLSYCSELKIRNQKFFTL